MIEEFSIQDVSKSAPVYNRKKLEWLNSTYIRAKEDGELSKFLTPYLQKSGIRIDQTNRQWLDQIAGILKDNLVVLSEVDQYVGIFFDEKFSFEEGIKAILQDPIHRETLSSVLRFLEDASDLRSEGQDSLLSQLERKTGRKGKGLYAPLRAAITGKTRGPELAKTLPLLGRERIIQRLKMALEVT
jgi:nondiscriminating glutamyl-tRNA synthetase